MKNKFKIFLKTELKYVMHRLIQNKKYIINTTALS